MLLASSFVAELDELKLHYDIRSIYAREMGQALAKTVDQNLLQLAVLGSQASATITGGNGGTEITDAAPGITFFPLSKTHRELHRIA